MQVSTLALNMHLDGESRPLAVRLARRRITGRSAPQAKSSLRRGFADSQKPTLSLIFYGRVYRWLCRFVFLGSSS